MKITLIALGAGVVGTWIEARGYSWQLRSVPRFALAQMAAMFGGLAFCALATCLVGSVRSIAGLRAAVWGTLWMGTMISAIVVGKFLMMTSTYTPFSGSQLAIWVIAALCLLASAARAWHALEEPLIDPGFSPRGLLAIALSAAVGLFIGWSNFASGLAAFTAALLGDSDEARVHAAEFAFYCVPWVLLPLPLLAAGSLHRGLETPAARHWVVALAGASTLTWLAPTLVHIARNGADAVRLGALGTGISTGLGVLVGLALVARAWHRSLDAQPDELEAEP